MGSDDYSLLAKVMEMQGSLLAEATGGNFDGGNQRFQVLRADLLRASSLKGRIPDFLKNNRDLFQFWEFIKHSFKHYAERRRFL
jgi:Abortive infection C-terminus